MNAVNKIRFLKQFRAENRGSVTVEFAFMLLFLGVLMIFMFDLLIFRSTVGKLDSASYSLVNIAKENRIGVSDINTANANILRNLASKLIFNEGDAAKTKIRIKVEQLVHDSTGTKKTVTESGDSDCKPATSLASKPELSPYSQSVVLTNRRQVPVYQVTLCYEINSIFKYFLVDDTNNKTYDLRSSSVAVGRNK